MKRAALLATILLAACAGHAAVPSAAPAPASPISAASVNAASPPAPLAPSHRACGHPVPKACDAPPPAYATDVMPILKKRCFGCHTGDGVAADEHDFSRIEGLRGARTEIVDEVSTCAMPPTLRLDDPEASSLLRWVACGQRTD